MKYPALLLFTIVILTSCGGSQSGSVAQKKAETSRKTVQADVVGASETPSLDADYKKSQDLLTDITRQMNQPNILKEDILRGWYLGSKDEHKFGTPNTWVFVEDGANSKWISPNFMEEGDVFDARELCQKTAGTYIASCLQTSDADCEYVDKSSCDCLQGSVWKDEQGCILVTDRGSFVSINSTELEQGWYLGLPNEKKLNTPSDWIWVEKESESVWQKEGVSIKD